MCRKILSLMLSLETLVALGAEPVVGERHTDSETEPSNRAASVAPVRASSQGLTLDAPMRLIALLFHLRPEQATIQEAGIRRALESEDEATAARGIAGLFNSIGREAKAQLGRDLQVVERNPELSSQPNLQRLVQRLRWTVEETDGRARSLSAVENRFKDALSEAFERAGKEAKLFHQRLTKAAEGDGAAIAQLKKDYGEQGLLDFMAAHPENPSAAKIAQTLGWRDKDGAIHLDTKKSNGETETWSLGEKPLEVQQNLRDFLTARGNGDHVTGVGVTVPREVTARRFVKMDPATHQIVAEPARFLVPADAEVCRQPSVPLAREIPLQRRPNYFFRPFPDSSAGSYAGADQNFLVDFGDGASAPQEYQVPGRWDPVPTPDERYLTVPSNRRDIEGLTFFSMGAMRQPPYGKQKALYEDRDMKGVYQSLGIVDNGDGGATTYRAIVVEGATLRVRDYTIKPDPSATGGAKVTPHGSAPLTLCKNLAGVQLSLPMISKNGKQLSAVDVKDSVTKIYNLAVDGSCTEEINLGIFTGKVDFGFDNDTITFHAFNNEKNGTEYIDVPSDERLANVYVYQRSTRKMTRVTNNTNANSVYPAFRRDGSLVYLQHPHGAAVNTPEKSKLVIVDPKRYDSSVFDQFTPGDTAAAARFIKLTALGTLWASVCSSSSENISQQSAVLNTLSLDRGRCLKVVGKYWEKNKELIFSRKFPFLSVKPEDLKSLTALDLQSVCPAGSATPTPTAPTTSSPVVSRTPQDLIGACLVCHDRPGFPKIPFADPAALRLQQTAIRRPAISLAEDIKRRLQEHEPRNGRMPPGESLRSDEVQALLRYLGI